MANADTPGDAETARNNGAEGIGLCRTEHMVNSKEPIFEGPPQKLFLSYAWFIFQFFASDERIRAVRQMIMAVTPQLRQKALDLLLPYQRSDFEGIFRAMDGNFILKRWILA